MRVAVLTSLYPSAPFPNEGVFAERRWQGMRVRGHEVRVTHPVPHTPPLLPGPGGRWARLASIPKFEERGGIEVRAPRYLHLPKRALANATRFARIGLEDALAGSPDVVVCDYAWPASAAAATLAERGVPCVISGRGSDVLQVAGEAGLGEHLATNLRLAGHWCAVSHDLLETMDRLGEGTGTLVANGVDGEVFHPRERAAARRELGLDESETVVLVVGHLIPRKDPLLALRAFAAGTQAPARLVFVGSGELQDEIEAEARRQGLEGRVRLVGEATPQRLATWYAAANALLLTSRREGRPNVVLEALASGCPVVATDAGGTGEILAGLVGEAPALVPSGRREPAEVGGYLRDVLSKPPTVEAMTAAVSAFTWDASLDALERVLSDAVGARA